MLLDLCEICMFSSSFMRHVVICFSVLQAVPHGNEDSWHGVART